MTEEQLGVDVDLKPVLNKKAQVKQTEAGGLKTTVER